MTLNVSHLIRFEFLRLNSFFLPFLQLLKNLVLTTFVYFIWLLYFTTAIVVSVRTRSGSHFDRTFYISCGPSIDSMRLSAKLSISSFLCLIAAPSGIFRPLRSPMSSEISGPCCHLQTSFSHVADTLPIKSQFSFVTFLTNFYPARYSISAPPSKSILLLHIGYWAPWNSETVCGPRSVRIL